MVNGKHCLLRFTGCGDLDLLAHVQSRPRPYKGARLSAFALGQVPFALPP